MHKKLIYKEITMGMTVEQELAKQKEIKHFCDWVAAFEPRGVSVGRYESVTQRFLSDTGAYRLPAGLRQALAKVGYDIQRLKDKTEAALAKLQKEKIPAPRVDTVRVIIRETFRKDDRRN